MKKCISAAFALLCTFATFAQAPNTSAMLNGKPIRLRIDSLKKIVKQGVSIIVLEANGCQTATTMQTFATSPNAGSSKSDAAAYKGLDASIADCCTRSTDGTFVLRISYVDCNGQAVANRRPYEAVTRCSATAKDLMPMITQQVNSGTASRAILYLKNIKVWQE